MPSTARQIEKTAKFTPGPWKVWAPNREWIESGKLREGGFDPHYIVPATAEADVPSVVVLTPVDAEGRANARLIAAAPTLFEALSVLLPFAVNDAPGGCDGSNRGCPHCEAIKNARKALAQVKRGARS